MNELQHLHPTTELCLDALQRLQAGAEFSNILDMGCGNGILSIIAARAWDARVLAVDISPQAVKDTQIAIAADGLGAKIEVLRSDGFSAPLIGQRAPYDLIICNLLADLLLKLAPDIKRCLAPGGYAILSGSLAWMAPGVEQAYIGLGFEIVEKIENSPWHACLVRHRNAT